MYQIDDDLTIHITRGDTAYFTVTAEENGVQRMFNANDVVRIKVMKKKDCSNVAFQKDVLVTEDTYTVHIILTEEETKIGDVISKPVDYWYEIELNPYTNPQTIIGYDEDGAKIFKVYPEGRDLGNPTPAEEVPVVDSELDVTSIRPIENQAVANAMINLENSVTDGLRRMDVRLDEFEVALEGLGVNKDEVSTKVTSEDGVHGFRVNNGTPEYFNGTEWVVVDGVNTSYAVEVTLPSTGWSEDTYPTQTVTVTGMTADMFPNGLSVVPGSDVETTKTMQEEATCINQIDTDADTMTFTCYETAPTVDLTIVVPVLKMKGE